MDELSFGGETYVSSKRAAELTGYAKDYIGQLCREGHVKAKMVGRSWYVLETGIREHRFGKPKEVAREASNVPVTAADTTATASEAPVVPSAVKMDDSKWLPETWSVPIYEPMPAPTIPQLAPLPSSVTNPAVSASSIVRDLESAEPMNSEGTQNIAMSGNEPTLEAMQAAWKEWFTQKSEPLLETPEIIDEREEEYEEELHMDAEEAPTPIAFQKVQKREEVAEEAVPIAVHRIKESVPVVRQNTQQERFVRPSQQADITEHTYKRYSSAPSAVTIAILMALGLAFVGIGIVGSGFGQQYVHGNSVSNFLGGTRVFQK